MQLSPRPRGSHDAGDDGDTPWQVRVVENWFEELKRSCPRSSYGARPLRTRWHTAIELDRAAGCSRVDFTLDHQSDYTIGDVSAGPVSYTHLRAHETPEHL